MFLNEGKFIADLHKIFEIPTVDNFLHAFLWVDKFVVCSVAYILHRFAKDRIIHEFVKVLFEIVRTFLSFIGVEIDVIIHERCLIVFDNSMDFS